MEEFNYKSEIINTRTGALGSSDGKMLMQIAECGEVPKSAHKRLAVCKGLIPQTEIPKTDAVRIGDEMENVIFNMLHRENCEYISNPCWVSEKYSRENVKLLTHPDIVLVDEKKKVIYIYEVKTTKYSVEQTKKTYLAQLFIHYSIGMEMAKARGEKWTVRLFLVHYSTKDLDLSDTIEFDNDRLTIKKITFKTPLFDISLGMDVVNTFLSTFNTYYVGEEIKSNMLPVEAKQVFDAAVGVMDEVEKKKQKIDEFKERLYKFMLDNNIKSIRDDVEGKWSITRVDPTSSVSFDAKSFMADYKASHPRKAKKLLADYSKTTNKKGYVTICKKKEKKTETE